MFIKKNEILYQITSSLNQINNNYKNISSIKMGECENILKQNYDIKKDIKKPYNIDKKNLNYINIKENSISQRWD